MDYVIFLLGAVTMYLVFLFYIHLNKMARKKEIAMDDDHFTVSQPKLAFWVGLVCVILFGGSTALSVFATLTEGVMEWWVYAVLIGFTVAGAMMMRYVTRWKLEVSSDGLVFTSLFVTNKKISLSDITKVVDKPQAIVIYTHDKRIKVEPNCPGYSKLQDFLSKQVTPVA